MTEDEFNSIPASDEAKAFFSGTTKATRAGE
jgi:hypothetical protein